MFPEVEVYRYVTEQTFDAYLYQLVESKQKFIAQVMTSKSPVRSAEDVDEVALSFPYEAELKEKTERLNALNIELNLDEKDTPVMDAEPEQSEEQPEKRSPARVR